jgi:cytokinin dehydrogenase
MADGTRLTRRALVRLAAAAAVSSVWPVATNTPPGRAEAPGSPQNLDGFPTLDGRLSLDAESVAAAAVDWGGSVRATPMAVVKPASVGDVVRAVQYANERSLRIAMRGQGHSTCGQAQVEHGIVIDSSSLNALRWHGQNLLDAEAGASWGAVVKTSLARGLTPPVLADVLSLTVGGTLSVGGTGETSYRAGAQVDHVVELDVVTGAGELVTCSPTRDAELFQMALAGLGQCGMIVRARLRLVPAPRRVQVRAVAYDTAEALIIDQARLARSEGPDLIGGEITRDSGGRWRHALLAGSFLQDSDEHPAAPPWLSVLRVRPGAPIAATSYWEYLDRRTASVAAAKARGNPNPSFAVLMPERTVAALLSFILGTPDASAGIWRVEVIPMITARFTQPLHRMPSAPLAFTLRLQRRATAADAPDHRAMLDANALLSSRARAAGGRIYPPFAPPLSPDGWQGHYGRQTWRRLAAAKRRYDPRSVLTPGPGIFGGKKAQTVAKAAFSPFSR